MSDGFLARWSRRKREIETSVPQATTPTPELASNTAPPLEPEAPLATDEEIAAALAELPPIDALTPETDVTGFLRREVPEALRNAALRKVWALDPAIRDFVNDAREYAFDYNTPGGAPGYGPLDPGDDVAAMVERVFGGSPRPVPPEEAPPQPAEPPAEAAAEVSPDEPDGEADAVATASLPAPEERDALPLPALEPEPAVPVRRHGRASPA
ncbi:MAG TPA: DUF3306 domain-containing protein [Beijerinckiaceae bacterium]|jgi:hypothetical protein